MDTNGQVYLDWLESQVAEKGSVIDRLVKKHRRAFPLRILLGVIFTGCGIAALCLVWLGLCAFINASM